MAQLGARLNGIEEAEGSSPSGSTFSQMASPQRERKLPVQVLAADGA